MPHNDDEMEVKIKLTQVEGRLNNLETKFDGFLSEIRAELKDIKTNTSVFNTVVVDHNYHKDSLNRAFKRIEVLEAKDKEYEAIINQVKGARTLAYTLWTILGTGVGALLIKVFFLV